MDILQAKYVDFAAKACVETGKHFAFGSSMKPTFYILAFWLFGGLGTRATAANLQPKDTTLLLQQLSSATGETRGKVLADLAFIFRRSDNQRSEKYALEAQKLLSKSSNTHLQAYSIAVMGLVQSSRGLQEKAVAYYDKALAQVSSPAGDTLLALIYNWRGLAFMDLGKYYRAEADFRQSALYSERVGDIVTKSKVQQNLGVVYYYRGQYSKAAAAYVESARTVETMKEPDTDLLGNIYLNIGITYKSQFMIEKAGAAYRKAEKYLKVKNQPKMLAMLYSNLGTYFFDLNNLDSSTYYHQISGDMYRKLGDLSGVAQSMNNLADILRERKKYTEALVLYRKSLAIRDSIGHAYGIVTTLRNIGITYRMMGNYAEAERYLKQSLKTSDQVSRDRYYAEGLQELAETYRLQGNCRAAYETVIQAQTLRDSLFTLERASTTEELVLAYEAEKNQREIERLENARLLGQQQLIGGGLLALALLVIALLAYNRQRVLRKRELELSEKERELVEERETLLEARADAAEGQKSLVEVRLQNVELEQQRLAALLEYKNKELMSFALRIIQKNDFLDELKENLAELKGQPFDATNLKRITVLINQNQVLDREREEFDRYVAQVNQDFFHRLSEHCPDLNETEKRICALLVLGLSSKEMASLLGVTYKTVDNYRSAIRKKLDVDSDANLKAILGAF
jgi:tetratricopeptide (TPR) repeat protein/DNA-binding CsgD family transcriptional regulator